jgi:hypothetical protein
LRLDTQTSCQRSRVSVYSFQPADFKEMFYAKRLAVGGQMGAKAWLYMTIGHI